MVETKHENKMDLLSCNLSATAYNCTSFTQTTLGDQSYSYHKFKIIFHFKDFSSQFYFVVLRVKLCEWLYNEVYVDMETL